MKPVSQTETAIAANTKPDLDSPEQIRHFLDRFYDGMLNDSILAPIFLDVAGIDIRVHLGHIQAYWEKLLLGEDNYHRHTMNIHRNLHDKRALTDADFDRWFDFFQHTVREHFSGAKADKAVRIAHHIAENMKVRIVHNSFDTPHHH